MATHGGFTTKHQETFYTTLLDKAIVLIVNKLINILDTNPDAFQIGNENDLKFYKHLRKIFKYVAQLDKAKQSGPKFGMAIEPLYTYFKENYDADETVSTLTSTNSVFKNLQGIMRDNSGSHELESMAGVTGGYRSDSKLGRADATSSSQQNGVDSKSQSQVGRKNNDASKGKQAGKGTLVKRDGVNQSQELKQVKAGSQPLTMAKAKQNFKGIVPKEKNTVTNQVLNSGQVRGQAKKKNVPVPVAKVALGEKSKSPRFERIFEHRIDEEEEKAPSGNGSAHRLHRHDSDRINNSLGVARQSATNPADAFLLDSNEPNRQVSTTTNEEGLKQHISQQIEQIEAIHHVKAPPDSAEEDNSRGRRRNESNRQTYQSDFFGQNITSGISREALAAKEVNRHKTQMSPFQPRADRLNSHREHTHGSYARNMNDHLEQINQSVLAQQQLGANMG